MHTSVLPACTCSKQIEAYEQMLINILSAKDSLKKFGKRINIKLFHFNQFKQRRPIYPFSKKRTSWVTTVGGGGLPRQALRLRVCVWGGGTLDEAYKAGEHDATQTLKLGHARSLKRKK